MPEFYLGEPVITEYFGKPLRVEPKKDNIEIVFGNRTLILKEQTVYQGLADTIKWMASRYDSTKEALDCILQDIIYTLDDQDLEPSQTRSLQNACEIIRKVYEGVKE